MFKRSDEDAPVSSLYLFGRKEDLAFEQQVDGNPRHRHHVRFWQTTKVDDDGRPIWVGSAVYDQHVGLSRTTGQITHVTAANVDAERDYLFQCLEKTGDLAEQYAVDDFHKIKRRQERRRRSLVHGWEAVCRRDWPAVNTAPTAHLLKESHVQYLIKGKLIAPDLLRLPHAEFIQIVRAKFVPALKLLVEGSAAGKVLAGGLPAGSREFVLVADLPDQNTHRVVRQFLQSLPIVELYDWQVTPLETLAECLQAFEGT